MCFFCLLMINDLLTLVPINIYVDDVTLYRINNEVNDYSVVVMSGFGQLGGDYCNYE